MFVAKTCIYFFVCKVFTLKTLKKVCLMMAKNTFWDRQVDLRDSQMRR